jgi:hypothetical protein
VELLSWRSIKDVKGDGGIIKTVLLEGEGWKKPNDGDELTGLPFLSWVSHCVALYCC